MDRSAADFLPEGRSLTRLRRAASGCRGCDLWKDATQTVFGEGPSRAELVLVGEQPGDQEDRQGSPFVGPPGGLLDRALAEAGIDRGDVYLTNAVKHFKWKQRGQRRLHQTTRDRGRPLETRLAPLGAVTIHPSAILRLRESDERHDAFAGLVADLQGVWEAMREGAREPA